MSAERRLEGRAVIVTGASRGIGRAIATRLAADGARLVLTAGAATTPTAWPRRPRTAARRGRDCRSTSRTPTPAAGSSTRCLERARPCRSASSTTPPVTFPARSATSALADWDRALRVNLTAAMLLAQAALPHLRAAGRGAIVNISSQRAFASGHGEPAYESAKAALLALTRSLAVDYGPDGIRSNCVTPGLILSERARRMARRRPTPPRGDGGGDAARPAGRAGRNGGGGRVPAQRRRLLHQRRGHPGRRRRASPVCRRTPRSARGGKP